MDYRWHIISSESPNKVWICDATGSKITKLVGVPMASRVVKAHNQIITYLENKPQPTGGSDAG